jgi:polyhydroxyalkanoate synthesis repressor PhaR
MSTAEQGPQEVVPIIRYPNRRLYDRSRGPYVTLQDVEDTVRRGVNVSVRDSKTGEDLTRSLLTQIILERHPERMDLFPLSLLHLIIRTDGVMFAFLRDSVLQALQYVEMLQRAAPFNPLLPAQEWLRTFLPESRARHGSEIDVGALLHRITELERRLDELRNAAQERPPRSTPRKKKPDRRGHRPKEERQ